MLSNLIDDEINYGVYRSNDPISNFKIRVKIERVTSNSLIPTVERLKIQEDLSCLLDRDGSRAEKSKPSNIDRAKLSDQINQTEYEEVVVAWQQKLFSKIEFETYERDLGSYSTPLQQKYVAKIQKMKAQRKQPGRIFTYIEDDSYCAERDLDFFMTDSPNEQPSGLALAMTTFRKHHVARSYSRQNDNRYIPRTDLIKENPTLNEIQTNHFSSVSYQTMYIMGDLSDIIDSLAGASALRPRTRNERVLCRINVYSNGTIVLTPDFNTGKLAYIIEAKNYTNDIYQYYIEHASIPVTAEYLIKENRLLNEICRRKQYYIENILGNQFDMPPPTVLKLNIFGEIVSGKNFDFDNIYVHYCLDIADNWFIEPSMLLSGYTHTASATASSRYDDIVYYSYPFEFELWYKPSPTRAAEELPQMPKIYFQVASLDEWNRHRTEGYTYIDIPYSPGFYDEHLACWRPRGNSLFDQLRYFYIGGSPELEDISYVSIPKYYNSGNNDKILSRFGFRTVTTGTLNVRFNVVFQSEGFARDYKESSRRSSTKHNRFNAFMINIDDTIREYERAKQRAYEVRERKLQELELNIHS